MARRIPYGWPGSQIYIHYHEENARAAAGSFGSSLSEIRQNATSQIRQLTTGRFSQTVFAGISPAELKGYANEIKNIKESIADTSKVTKVLSNLLEDTFESDQIGTPSFAKTVSNKVATLIGGIGSNYKNINKVTDQVNELINLYYDTDLNSLIQIKKNIPTAISRAQYESLIQLQKYLNRETMLSLKDIRNLLVDIFTEQGLPDFLQKCAKIAEQQYDNLVDSAIHLGKANILGSQAQGKIDVNITFNIPNGSGKTQKITQGISVKSNYFGMQANVLSTTLAKSLKYSGLGDLEAQANAISLMNDAALHRWFVWANLDRALQGTSQQLDTIYDLQDRADVLLEFTADGFQIYNINEILFKLAKAIQNLGNESLGKLGYGVRSQYNALTKYDRSKYTYNTPEVISDRANYSNRWLTATHTITLNAHTLWSALQN